MRKVLIITYYWPPAGGGGVQRWLKFAKYLPESGWTPVIYTPLNPDYPIIDYSLEKEVPADLEVVRHPIFEVRRIYKRLKKLRHGKKTHTWREMDLLYYNDRSRASWFQKLALRIRANHMIPDARKYWIKPSVTFLGKWLKSNHVDMIVSTGPPHSCHLIAMGLKAQFDIPWVADFRDPWLDIEYFEHLGLHHKAHKKHLALQNQVLRSANHVITVSPSWQKLLAGYGANPVSVITNGFDTDDIGDTDIQHDLPGKSGDAFDICSVGTLLQDRNPQVLWQALEILFRQSPDLCKKIRLHFAGHVAEGMIEYLIPELRDQVKFHGYLNHREAVSLMKSADLLLLVHNAAADNNVKGRIPGKVFEYLAVKRPIVLIGRRDSDLGEMVALFDTNYVVEQHNAVELAQVLYQRMTSRTSEKTEHSRLIQYSRRSLTHELAKVFHSITN